MITIKSSASLRSTSSQKSAQSTTAIDPGQLLALCYNIKETMSKLTKSINLTRFRLVTLGYIGDDVDDFATTKCSNDLVEVDQLSKQLVSQLDELQAKVTHYSDDPISFQIASQQLAYFASEWHDNMTVQFSETLRMANDKLKLGLFSNNNATNQEQDQLQQQTRADPNQQASVAPPMNSAEVRVRDALLRLKQSMEENEKLIVTIANNLEYTKAAIEAICESIRVARVGLDESDKNAFESIQTVRDSRRLKLILIVVCLLIVAFIVWLVLRFIGIL